MGIFRRKQYLIDWPFQMKCLMLTVSILILQTILVLAVIFAPTAYVLFSDLPIEQKADAAKSILFLHKNIWPGIITVIALFGFVSIFISHKLAGPLYKIKSVLGEIAAGDYSIRVNLRKGDELTDLADQINIISDLFNVSRTNLIKKNETINEDIDALRQELSAITPDKSAANKLLEKIEAVNLEVSSILNPRK